jgi:hypothetical protein
LTLFLSLAKGLDPKPVSADIQTAPRPRATLAGVVEEEYAIWVLAPAEPAQFTIIQQQRKRICDRRAEHFRLGQSPPFFELKPFSLALDPDSMRVRQQEFIRSSDQGIPQ